MDRPLCDHVIALALLLSVATQVLSQLCERPCQCPSPAPQCPRDVPLVLDGCGCCQTCARQQGEPCSLVFPCDGRKGLQCDYSASFPGDPGECVSQEDLGCEINGVSYHDGQAFQPSCDTYCRCNAGGVTCVPVCPVDARLPTPDCPHPQHVLLQGKCCKEWVCENLKNTVIQDAIAASRPNMVWPALPGNHHLIQQVPQVYPCTEHSTHWSACSRTCGAGFSTRVSNQNTACRLEMQTRLCKVRPCQGIQQPHHRPARGRRGQCQPSHRPPLPVRLVHQGCFSTQRHRLRYCGQCADSRCCTPHRTHTAEVAFRCADGRTLQRSVMMIDSCVCHRNCPHSSGGAYSAPGLRSYGP